MRLSSAATLSVFTFGPAINYVVVNCATAFEKASLIPLARFFIAAIAPKLISTTSKAYSTRS